MDIHSAKALIKINDEAMTHLKLDKDWILQFDNMEELGKAVKDQMVAKVTELTEWNRQLENIIKEIKNKPNGKRI
jgi:hypothetical protein